MTPRIDEGWRVFRKRLALRKLGHLPYEAMPAAALEALMAGCDSPSLAELAAMEGETWSLIRPVLKTVQHEIDADISDDEARVLAADSYLADVATGALDPGAMSNFWWASLLSDLEGVYRWFGWAVYELDLLDSLDPDRQPAATGEVRRRAAWALAQTPAARRTETTPPGDDRYFLRRD